MSATPGKGEIDSRFGSEGAVALDWSEVEPVLTAAEIYWLSTTRVDGRPHVTPVIGLWIEGAFYFTTGDREQKAHNLATNNQVAVTTGNNKFGEGLDVIIEGSATPARGQEKLQRVVDQYQAKYGWAFFARDDQFFNQEHGGEPVLLYEIRPAKVFAYLRGDVYSQTRWKFA